MCFKMGCAKQLLQRQNGENEHVRIVVSQPRGCDARFDRIFVQFEKSVEADERLQHQRIHHQDCLITGELR